MKKHAAAWAKGLLQYGIGFGLLAYILWRYWEPQGSSPGIKGLLNQTPDFLLFAAVVVCGASVSFIQFVRWYFLVRALDLPFTIRNAFRLGLVGVFYNAFLPGSVGGDLLKAYFIAKDSPGRRAAAVATVIADRLVGLFGLIWFSAVVGGGFWLAGDERIATNDYLKGIIRVCAGVVVVTVVVWVVMGFLPQRRADRFARRLNSIPKLGHTLSEMWFAVWTYRQRPKVIYALIGLTAVCHIAMVLMLHFAVRVFSAADPGTIPEHFVIGPIGYIAQAFFPAPGGVGGAEAIFGYLYTLLGRSESTGVVGRLTMRVFEWGFGFVGYMVYLWMRKELPAVEAAAEEGGLAAEPESPAGSNTGTQKTTV
ncbi:MAG TPA: lysylphosphatidylglycerol synthase transmembrane domain-containing protein [Gemmataceae bacterium]|nr:lysylphosphatidylglycerol synthase transmembrane domain-containing protein [Gemmataceae bacterium]